MTEDLSISQETKWDGGWERVSGGVTIALDE